MRHQSPGIKGVPVAGLWVLCLALLSVGCEHDTAPPPYEPAPVQRPSREAQTKLQLEERYEAANKIRSFVDRDQALSDIATDAADAGNSTWAWAAVKGISAFPVRDITARRCAERFDAMGRRDIAQEFADSIMSFPIRDEVQRKFAAEAPLPPQARVRQESSPTDDSSR